MSMPIRRTTARLALTGAMALGSAGLIVAPAVAQQRPYPPPQIDVQVVTPGATISVTGSGWGEGTQVTITRHRGQNRSTTEAETTTATVQADGTFEAPVTVPEDAGGTEVRYVISGVDEQGDSREETRALNVQLTSAEMEDADDDLAAPFPVTEDDGGVGVALIVGGAAALAGGAAVARRRVRQGS